MSESSDAAARALTMVVRDLGRRVGERPGRVRAVLADALGDLARAARSDVDALVVASEEDVPRQLVLRSESQSAPDPSPESSPSAPDLSGAARDEDLVTRVVARGLDDATARYAVHTWAGALGVAALTVTDRTSGPDPGRPDHAAASDLGPIATTGLAGTDGLVSTPPTAEFVMGGTEPDPGAAAADPALASTLAGAWTVAPPTEAGTDADAPPRPPNGQGQTAGGIEKERFRRRGAVIAAAAAVALVVGGTAFATLRPPSDVGAVASQGPTTGPTSGPGEATGSAPTSGVSTSAAASTSTDQPTSVGGMAEAPTTPTAPQPAAQPGPQPAPQPAPKTVPKAPAQPPSSTQPPPPPAPAPAPAPAPTLTAGNTSASWTVTFTGSNDPGCYLQPPPHLINLRPCGGLIPVVKAGTATSYTVEVAAAQWGTTSVQGTRVLYVPGGQGWGTETFSYRLRSGSLVSNWASITVVVACNSYVQSC